jgi:hypothetical protein
MNDDSSRVAVPLKLPLEAVLSEAKPYSKAKMVDAELQEKLDEAAGAGNWMAAVWHLAGDKVHLFAKTREFARFEMSRAGYMMLGEIQRWLMADETTPVMVVPWGSWWPLVESELVHLDTLHVGHGGFSSIHMHEKKTNVFMPMFGAITVETFHKDLLYRIAPEEGPPVIGPGAGDSKTVLKPNTKPLVVPAGTPHKFSAEHENTLTLELSLPTPGPLNREDIERFTEHGFDDPN